LPQTFLAAKLKDNIESVWRLCKEWTKACDELERYTLDILNVPLKSSMDDDLYHTLEELATEQEGEASELEQMADDAQEADPETAEEAADAE